MTLPDNRPARKPRRLGLIIPWAVAGVLVVGWSLGWFWLKGETERRMDAARVSMAQSGWRLDWSSRRVSGFPFRLNVDLTNARWGEASGWSVTAPVLKAQAYVSAADHWILVAPEGVVLTRPREGDVKVSAGILRGSLSQLNQHPPTISIESFNLVFTTRVGAAPFWTEEAKEFHFHAKAGPDDQGAFYLEVDGAPLRLPKDRYPTDRVVDAIYSHASALKGADWPSAVRSWRAAGGTITVRHEHFQVAPSPGGDSAGTLTVRADGQLSGAASVGGRSFTADWLQRLY